MPFFLYIEQFKEAATKTVRWVPIAGGCVAGVVLIVIVLMSIIRRRRGAFCPFNYRGNKRQTLRIYNSTKLVLLFLCGDRKKILNIMSHSLLDPEIQADVCRPNNVRGN